MAGWLVSQTIRMNINTTNETRQSKSRPIIPNTPNSGVTVEERRSFQAVKRQVREGNHTHKHTHTHIHLICPIWPHGMMRENFTFLTRTVCCIVKIMPQNRPRRPRGGAEVQLYSLFNLGARWGWVVNATPRPLQPRERPAHIV